MSVSKEAPQLFDVLKNRLLSILALGLAGLLVVSCSSSFAATPQDGAQIERKRLIGPITTIEETESHLNFKASVDKGATTSSVHVEEWTIEGGSLRMSQNIGKTIRFLIKNHHGQSQWLKRKIVEISAIKTSEQIESRYKVQMTLRHNDVKKLVLVSLNDRPHMNYPLLLGHNFLRGDYVVDVSLKADHNSDKAKSEPAAEPKEANSRSKNQDKS